MKHLAALILYMLLPALAEAQVNGISLEWLQGQGNPGWRNRDWGRLREPRYSKPPTAANPVADPEQWDTWVVEPDPADGKPVFLTFNYGWRSETGRGWVEDPQSAFVIACKKGHNATFLYIAPGGGSGHPIQDSGDVEVFVAHAAYFEAEAVEPRLASHKRRTAVFKPSTQLHRISTKGNYHSSYISSIRVRPAVPEGGTRTFPPLWETASRPISLKGFEQAVETMNELCANS